MKHLRRILIGLAILIVVGAAAYLIITRPLHLSDRTAGDRVAGEAATGAKTIVAVESSASFDLYEDLRGTRTHVIGTTPDVAGTVSVTQSPAAVSIGTVAVNMQTLKTDSAQRDGAIGRMILESEKEANQFATLANASVSGLPETIEFGAEFPFTVSGDLTIKGVTKPSTWTATGTLAADGTFSAKATTKVTYGDYGIKVPDFPFLANVEKDATLSISIVAR